MSQLTNIGENFYKLRYAAKAKDGLQGQISDIALMSKIAYSQCEKNSKGSKYSAAKHSAQVN